MPDFNWHRFWRFYFSVYSLVIVSIEKIYQTFETVFHRQSKHLKFCQKYSAARRTFNSLLGVWISRWNTVSHAWDITSSWPASIKANLQETSAFVWTGKTNYIPCGGGSRPPGCSFRSASALCIYVGDYLTRRFLFKTVDIPLKIWASFIPLALM